jgi:hypothetical protein
MTIGTITGAIAASAPIIQERLITVLADREINKRAEMLITAMDRLANARSTANRFKPDVVTYNGDGTKASETWSKKGLEESIKASQLTAKWIKTIEVALDKGDFNELAKMVNQPEGKVAASVEDA